MRERTLRRLEENDQWESSFRDSYEPKKKRKNRKKFN